MQTQRTHAEKPFLLWRAQSGLKMSHHLVKKPAAPSSRRSQLLHALSGLEAACDAAETRTVTGHKESPTSMCCGPRRPQHIDVRCSTIKPTSWIGQEEEPAA